MDRIYEIEPELYLCNMFKTGKVKFSDKKYTYIIRPIPWTVLPNMEVTIRRKWKIFDSPLYFGVVDDSIAAIRVCSEWGRCANAKLNG